MQKRGVIAIPMLIVLALGITGLAYAHWEKTITISGSVASGTVDLHAISVSHNDMGKDPSGPDNWYDKDIAKTTMVIDPTDPERVIITIENAYPCYDVWWHVTIRNVGTIPVKLENIRVLPHDNCITVEAWDGLGEQLDPHSWGGDPINYQHDYSGRVHVEQCAKQGTTYRFTIEFVFWNWNEVP